MEKNENDNVHILDCNDDNNDDEQEEEQTDLLTSHAAYREIQGTQRRKCRRLDY